jgi:hypothetical protein
VSTQITPDELARLFPKASASCLAANSAPTGPEPKQVVRDGALAEKEREAGNSRSLLRSLVRITSYRRRLLDFDNLAGGCKYFCDCCVYAQLIPDDAPEHIILEVRQEKVKTKAEEKTLIELIPI